MCSSYLKKRLGVAKEPSHNIELEQQKQRGAELLERRETSSPIFECPQTWCGVGPYCTPKSGEPNKRIRIENDHLQMKRDFVDTGGITDSHDNIPRHILNLIVQRSAMKQQCLRRNRFHRWWCSSHRLPSSRPERNDHGWLLPWNEKLYAIETGHLHGWKLSHIKRVSKQ